MTGRLYRLARSAVRTGVSLRHLSRRDVLLASFPRSGNTWVRFFLAHLVRLREGTGARVDFEALDRTMAELGVGDLRAVPTPETLPRVVKTHLPYSRLLGGRRAVLIVRDPVDVLASFYEFERRKRAPRVQGSFSDLLRHRRFGVGAWARHYVSWAPHATVELTYAELRADPVAEFGRLLAALGVEAEPGVVEEAARRASLGRVWAVEAESGLTRPERFAPDFRFAPDGRPGRGRALYSDADLAYLRRQLAAHHLDPDAWHR